MEVKVFTAPDLDHTTTLKIMLVDFEWSQIEQFALLIQNTPEPVNIMLYGENENDVNWCLNAAAAADAILINCEHKGKIELLKGYLLGYATSEAFGINDLALFAREVNHDMPAWYTKVLTSYKRKWNKK